MKEKVSRRKEGKSTLELRAAFEAITVGSGRNAEPYIIAFSHKSDNVAGRCLGTLFGFFEVEVHDEDAAYIVNFLASVAKKEYFANPRRPVEDGFETTLHKVNVALAEIAKEGNVSWLGHLHGIIGAISDGTVHFSATGDGVLSLAREESFLPISDGLAENLSEPHPLKTFTEVSSGRLMEGDVLLALSPAVWTLFTPEDLKKNIRRFTAAEFEQFLRTALINELPIAGAVIARITAETIPLPVAKKISPASSEEEASSTLTNVWSKQAFERAKAARLNALEAKESSPEKKASASPQEEYIDRKTGHIYVQGDSEDTHAEKKAWPVSIDIALQTFSRNWFVQKEKLQRFVRRSRKNTAFFVDNVSTLIGRLGRSVGRRTRTWLRHRQEAREAKRLTQTEQVSQETPTLAVPTPITTTSAVQRGMGGDFLSRWRSVVTQRTLLPDSSLPLLKSVTVPIKNWLLQISDTLQKVLHRLIAYLRNLTSRLRVWWQPLPSRQKSFLLGAGLIFLTFTFAGFFYANRSSLWDTPPEDISDSATLPLPTETPAEPESDEPLAIRLSEGQGVVTPQGEVIALASINDIPFGISRNQVTNIQTNEVVSTPEPIRLATAMDDLDALFLLGNSGTLYMYTIVNKKFETSTLTLPPGAKIDAIGTYLTYLYVLDRGAGTIYRFPRAEGGFGTPITWSRELLKVSTTSPLAISESIALIGEDNSLGLYERGRKTAIVFGGTRNPFTPKQFTFDKKTGDILVLDTSAKRVVRWSPTGTLIAQYFHDSFGGASALLTDSNNTLLITRPDGIFAFPLP